MKPSKADRCRHAKLASEAGRAASGRHHVLVGLLDRPLCALIENPAGLGRDHTARRTHQQANSQPLLELDNSLRDGRLSDALMSSHRRKRTGIDDAYEDFQCCESIHLALHWNKPYPFLRLLPTKW